MNSTSKAKNKNSPQLISFGGGKGGIGKSIICSNVAVCLSQLGFKVLLVDFDLGGANAHTCLGIQKTDRGLSDFTSGRSQSLESVITKTEVHNLDIISGALDDLNITDLDGTKALELIGYISYLKYDYILLDLGAGTSAFTISLFNSSDEKVIVSTPEPTSIENAYRFMKVAFYKKLKTLEKELGLEELLESAMNKSGSKNIKTPADLIKYVAQQDFEKGETLSHSIKDYHYYVLINQCRTQQDRELSHAMKSISQKYFGISVDSLGYIDFDNSAWQALRKRLPIVIALPYSVLTSGFFRISKDLSKKWSAATQKNKKAA